MDIEQLKLVLEVVGKATDGAYVIGLLYMLQPYAQMLGNLIVWPTCFYIIGRVVYHIISTVFCSSKFREALHPNSSSYDKPLSNSDELEILSIIKIYKSGKLKETE